MSKTELEVKARAFVITDARDAFAFRRYVREEVNSLARPTKALWKEQGKIITPKSTQVALQAGSVPTEWSDPWARMIREYVRDAVFSTWLKGLKTGGDRIAKKVNRLQRKQYDFDTTMTAIKAWLDSQGGALIVDLTEVQMASIHALLQDQIALGVTSPQILAQRLKPIIGLTEREANAVAKMIASLTEEGVNASKINIQLNKYASYLHKNRAARIARTEISKAYNAGQLESLKQAVAAGELPGIPEKSWIAGGADPCEICLENEAAGPIALEEVFPSGDQHPPAHPNDQCAVGYQVRR